MTTDLSSKLKNISFLLMFMVVYIHGYNLNVKISSVGNETVAIWLKFFETFISDGVCRVAVPMFFAISGYLACVKIRDKFTWAWYANLLKKKFFSLLVPFLMVSALGIFLVVILQLIPFSKPYFNNFNLSKTTFGEWIFIWLVTPVSFQLWFIRFLCHYFLIFPVLFFMVRYFKVVFIILLCVIWSLYSIHHYLYLSKIELEGLTFFSIGLLFSILNITPQLKVNSIFLIFLIILWLGWISFRTYYLIYFPFEHNIIHFNIIAITLVGFFLFWLLYDSFHSSFQGNKWFQKNVSYAIGVFLFHEPFLTIVKKMTIKLLGMNDLSLLFSFLISPMIAFFFALHFSKFLETKLKPLYLILTGNRVSNSLETKG